MEPNEAQREVIETRGDVLCCACPGSGKTGTVVKKAEHVLDTRADARITLVTFSRDAAAELTRRIRQVVDPHRRARIEIGTFHSLALKQLRGAGRMPHIAGSAESRHLVRQAIYRAGFDVELEEAEAMIAEGKTDPVFRASSPIADAIISCYEGLQAKAGTMDFTDILIRANEQMAAGELRPMQMTHLFVDEFQDIDRTQFAWMSHQLSQGVEACAVGDDDQSIFAFRKSLGYAGMRDFVDLTNARLIRLDTNYRCGASILAAARRLIECNLDRVDKDVRAHRGCTGEPVCHLLGKRVDQSAFIAELVMSRAPMPTPEPTVAILARMNHQLDALECDLRDQGFAVLRRGRSFWDIDYLEALTACLNTLCRRQGLGVEALLRWSGLPHGHFEHWSELAGGELLRLTAPNNEVPLVDLPGTREQRDLISVCRAVRRRLARRDDDEAAREAVSSLADWMREVMTSRPGARLTGAGDGGEPIYHSKVERQLDVLRMARESLLRREGPLSARLMSLAAGSGKNGGHVVLTTFHGSKGLEWDHVILADLSEASVPKLDEDASDAHVEEERRLFYVAMTRARLSLTLVVPAGAKPSEFIADAGIKPQAVAAH